MAAGILAVLAAVAPPGVARAAVPVSIQFAAFGPDHLDVLPGETVAWENMSDRRHTVTADDGSFASGDLFGGDTFLHAFDASGSYAYHCTVHPGMAGVVDVRPVTLSVLPVAPVPAGDAVRFDGRTADPGAPVRIERVDGAAVTTVAVARPTTDGTWSTTIAALRTGDYRAASAQGASLTRRLLVSDRRVLVRAVRGGVVVTVTPSLPYARVVLQQHLRERFGWWPQARARLDYVSQARFRVSRGRLRVVLVDRDGWTPIATSAVVVVRRGVDNRARPGRPRRSGGSARAPRRS